MEPPLIGYLAFFAAWIGGAVSGGAVAVLRWRRYRAFRQRHPRVWKTVHPGPYFRRGEHLRLGDPVLDAAAERVRLAEIACRGLWLGGALIMAVLAAFAWAPGR